MIRNLMCFAGYHTWEVVEVKLPPKIMSTAPKQYVLMCANCSKVKLK